MKYMKTKIKSQSRTSKQVILVFELDKNIITNIEKIFKKLKPHFKLSDYKKKYGDKTLDNFWELQKANEEFNFSLIVKTNIITFKLKSNLTFIKKFLKSLEQYTEFSELSSVNKSKLERRKIVY